MTTDMEYLCWGNSKGYRLSKQCLVESFDVPLTFKFSGEANNNASNNENGEEKQDLNASSNNMMNVSQRNLNNLL